MPEVINKSEEQKDAEADVEEFKEDLGPFVVAAETTRMGMVFTDAKEADNPIIFANDSFLALTGYKRKEVLGQSFNFFLAHAGMTRRWRKSRPSSQTTHIVARKSATAARTEANSGPGFSSARFSMRMGRPSNISHRSLISQPIRRSRRNCACSSMS